jgi:hypothetical protein
VMITRLFFQWFLLDWNTRSTLFLNILFITHNVTSITTSFSSILPSSILPNASPFVFLQIHWMWSTIYQIG